MDYVQLVLQLVNMILSAVGIVYWVRIGRANLSLRTSVWWPVALLINNAIFSAFAILWYLEGSKLVPPIILNYWGQAIRIQLGVTIGYGAWLMDTLLTRRRKT